MLRILFSAPDESKKVAVIRAPEVGYDSSAGFAPGKSYALIELPTGKVVKTTPDSVERREHGSGLGDKAWWFVEIETPSMYAVVDLEKGIRLADFSMGEHVSRM
jgi:endoglucanase